MNLTQRLAASGLCLSIIGAAAAAGAQDYEHNDNQREIFYVAPIVGVEYVGIGSAALQSDYQGVNTTRSSGVGLAYGGHAGFSFGSFRLGAMFQQTQLFQSDGLNFNKLYLEAGLGGRRGIVGMSLTLAGGWAFFGANGLSERNGAGGRLTFATDFYINRYFSLGPEVSVDGAAYFGDQTVYGSWGVTGALRVGIHL